MMVHEAGYLGTKIEVRADVYFHLLEGQWLDGHLLFWEEGLWDEEDDEEDVKETDEGGQDHNGLIAPWDKRSNLFIAS